MYHKSMSCPAQDRKTHSMNRRRWSPCEDDVNGDLVDGRVEGRTGVQLERVESDVVLICDRFNKERRVRHAVLNLKMTCFHDGHNASSGLEPWGLEPHEKSHVCGSVKCACLCEWVERGVRNFCQEIATPIVAMRVLLRLKRSQNNEPSTDKGNRAHSQAPQNSADPHIDVNAAEPPQPGRHRPWSFVSRQQKSLGFVH